MTVNPDFTSEGDMNHKNITVAGSGVLGSQIAFQTAYKGFVDKTWMIATGAPEGPFAILDAIDINSAFNIVVAKANATRNPGFANLANLLKTEYLEKGKLGRATGRGFYTYPNPSFASPNFLRN
jgi:3-hydroxyacyl-CoA dehydrogenase